ncbi:hypothetical protein QVD17_26243 [Tagetes erecta]|uniref:Uncharacterized protein n=1 Tax=Tagetes erecta TaxID=13708 RepID=A0AAD8NQM4_TARER|nr:hypothetical protein QVD17_26243 [Tagetes erecta]
MDHIVNEDDHGQELEALETLSLTDFPLTEHRDSDDQDHNIHASPSPATDQDLFEFGSSGIKQHMMNMSHAEDIISFGKLIPIKDQQPPKTQNDIKRNEKHIIHSGRCESMRELKSNTNKKTASQLFRNSYSLDYKKLNRNNISKLSYEATCDIYANRNSLSTKSSSSRWTDLVFAPLNKVPPEMDLRDIRNRQIVQSTSNRFSFNGASGDHHRKTSWGVLGFLSCKSSGSVAVTMPLS